jgi:hypothetical protein
MAAPIQFQLKDAPIKRFCTRNNCHGDYAIMVGDKETKLPAFEDGQL